MIAPALSPSDLLRLWERAESPLSDPARATLLLEFARPGAPSSELGLVSVGARDRQLLELSERPAGSGMALCGECPACDERVELTLDPRELLAPGGEAYTPGATHRLEENGIEVEFRLPDSSDLAAAAQEHDVAAARQCLLDRCVVSAGPLDDGALRGSELAPWVQAALEREMERLDPLAVVEVVLTCPGCEHVWAARVDVSDLVWADLSARARRLLREVSLLAQMYHWSEANILAMTPARRQAYLELAQP
jgi:hypothetical protein